MGHGFTGTKILSDKLTQILYTHIKHNLPDIVKEISERIVEVTDRLEELGPPMPEDSGEKLQMAWSMVMEFCSNFKDAIAGKAYQKKNRKEKKRKYQGGAQIKIMYYHLFREFAMPNYRITEEYDDDLMIKAITLHEGDSIPGFPSADVFVSLMQPNLEQLKNPALDLLNDVYNYLEELAGEIQAQTFIRFPGLGEEIMEKILEIMQDDREKARYLVESVLDSEQIYMFTNDTEYLNTRTDIVTVTYFTIDRKIGKKSKRLPSQVLCKALVPKTPKPQNPKTPKLEFKRYYDILRNLIESKYSSCFIQ